MDINSVQISCYGRVAHRANNFSVMNTINIVRTTNKDDEPFEKPLESMSGGGFHSYNDSIRPGDGVPNTVWESNLTGTEAPVERR